MDRVSKAHTHLSPTPSVDCRPGTYYDVQTPGATSSSDCKECPIGKHGPSEGAFSLYQCIGCSKGKFNPTPGQGSCSYCSPGKYGLAVNTTDGNTGCGRCPAGKFSSVEGITGEWQCQSCPMGRYGTLLGALYLNQACKECPIGKKGVGLGSSSDAACIGCEPGSYQPTAGESFCLLCGKGKYGNQLLGNETSSLIRDNETRSCTVCPENTFSGAFGAASSVVS